MRYKGQIEVVASIIEVIKFKFAVTINLKAVGRPQWPQRPSE